MKPSIGQVFRYTITILWVTVKRIINNRGLTIAILCGLVLAVSMMAAIPIYSSGSLHASFVKAWLQVDSFRPPFTVIMSHRSSQTKESVTSADLLQMERYVDRALNQMVGDAPKSRSTFARIGSLFFLPRDADSPNLASPRADLAQMSNLQELAEIIDGRWYQARDDQTVEVVVDETTLEKMELVVGDKYTCWYRLRSDTENNVSYYLPIPVEIVGLFRPKPGYTTEHWIYPPPYIDRLFANPAIFEAALLANDQVRLDNFDLHYVFEYENVRVDQLDQYIGELQNIEARAASIAPGTKYWLSPLEFFQDFHQRAQTINFFLVALAATTIGMILYYITLIAGLTVEHRHKEIVVLYSRGASGVHVQTSFFLEWLLLGIAAVIIGPFIGMFITKVMGSSSGFLSFVDRKAIPAALTMESYQYALLGSILAIVAGMLPVISYSRQSIVTYSRNRASRKKGTVWHRYFLDVILLAIAVYLFQDLNWETMTAGPENAPVADPILFLIPFLATMGVGLLLLRLYPLLTALLAWIANRFPGVVWQLALKQITRNASRYVPLLLLLIVTISMGIYNASVARTLSVNFEDQVYYHVGADLQTQEEWNPPDSDVQVITAEPPFLFRNELPGVVNAARVFRRRVSVRRDYEYMGSGVMMGVEPYEFAQTAWYRYDFGPAHFYEYLDVLSRHPEGVIVNTEFMERNNLTLGDTITVSYEDQPIEAYVVASIDFWPTMNPYEDPFFILNLTHVQENTVLEPYDVWYKLETRQHVDEMVDSLVGRGIYVVNVEDAHSRIVEMKREPYRMGFFGILSMGFLVAVIVTILGFLIYTFFSIRSQMVQFGSLRAIGLSLQQLVAILGLENLFTLGLGIGIGTGLGMATTRVFVPFLRARTEELEAAPPFLIITEFSDIQQIFFVLGFLFLVTVIGLSFILVNMRLSQAIKLGEEA